MTNLKRTWTVSGKTTILAFFRFFVEKTFPLSWEKITGRRQKEGAPKKPSEVHGSNFLSSSPQTTTTTTTTTTDGKWSWKKGHAIARRFIPKLWNWASLSSRKQSSGSLFINPAISAPRLNNFRTTVINGFCQLKSNVLYLPQGNSADGVGQEINSVWSWLRGSRFNSSYLLAITPSYAKLS